MSGRVALFVDDEAFFLSSIVEGLRMAVPKLEVLTAGDGIDALAILDRRSIDVLVTDIQMPRLDGLGLIAEIDARGLDVSVVVMTAYSHTTLFEREPFAVPVKCLEKPIDFSQLLETLNQSMQTRAPGALDSKPQPQPERGFPALEEHQNMDNTKKTLDKTSDITGMLGAALVDFESGMSLGTIGTGIDLEVACAGNMEVMRAKHRVMKELGIKGGIEDILITLESQYHIIRPVGAALFLYLALSRKDGNLAMARRKLANVAEELQLD